MKTLTINEIPIDIHDDKTIGLSLSGGADSALLLYILMTHTDKPIHLFSFFPKEKRIIAMPAVERVVNRVCELTGKNNIVHHKIDIEVYDNKLLPTVMNEYITRGEIDIIYTGLTIFPPDDVISEWEDKPFEVAYEIRQDNGLHRNLYYGFDDNMQPTFEKSTFYRPYMNYNKRYIAGIYRELDLEESLFPYTRTCEDITILDGHCGKCFWCKEREWGFGHL